MNEQATDDIIVKIIKLLELGKEGRGATQEEALLALEKAKALMARYQISMAQVDGALLGTGTKRREVKLKDVFSWRRRGSMPQFDQWLASAVATITSTRAYIHRDRPYVDLYFLGDEPDCAIAVALFGILTEMRRELMRVCCGSGWSPEHRSFSDGFATAVLHRAKAETKELRKEEAQTLALIVRDKNAIIEQEMRSRRMKHSRSRSTRQYDSYSDGYRAGSTVNLSARKTIGDGN